jgi:glyoxylase-like metal-dependent hydrolase (beta-lactamase superfamily II)
MLKIKTFCFNPFYENTYLLSNSKEAIVIDPGCLYEDEFHEFDQYIVQNDIIIKAILITHGHLDHIFGCKYLYQKYRPEIYLPEPDESLYSNLDQASIQFNIEAENPPENPTLIRDESVLEICGLEIKPLFTPGHTKGEYCYYLEKQKICFTGDVLFSGSIGRTDLWGGDYDSLIRSINNKLLTLDDEVTVYSGHGPETSIGREKKINPYLR